MIIAGLLLGGACALCTLVPVQARETDEREIARQRVVAAMTAKYGADWQEKMCASYDTNRTQFQAMKRYFMELK